MSKLIPLLSDGMIDALNSILETTESTIASELLEAHNTILAYNSDFSWMGNDINKELLKSTLLKRINELITDEVRALSIRRDVFEIAFTPKGKELFYTGSGTWSRENRQTGKPGRIIKKLMKFDYKEKDIEIFNNLLKAHMISTGNFKIVKGSDITKYYHEDTYYKISGTLGNSCMRYDECSNYFEIYEDHAKMLVCFKNELVMGRALVWEVNGITYMDRVYTCEDYIEEQFFAYAKENGWYVRDCNGLLHSGETQYWRSPEGLEFGKNLCIKLSKHYTNLPYVDSFRYYDPCNNTINTVPFSGCINLDSTDGSYEGYPYACDCCGEIYISYDEDEMPDELCWSEYEDCYLCNDCRIWCEGVQDYIKTTTPCIEVYTSDGIIDYPTGYVLDNSINIHDIHIFGTSSDYFVKINHVWYTIDNPKLTIVDDHYIDVIKKD